MAILAAEEAKWAALLKGSSSYRTNVIREVRHKTLQVAQRRIQTVLNRLAPKDRAEVNLEMESALEKLGL